jgi:multicomponent Na+:H+ antiporter subunit B
LIKSTVGIKAHTRKNGPDFKYLFFALLFVGFFIWFSYQAIVRLPAFGSPVMKMGGMYLSEAIRKTSATNAVSAIILDFRGYDTLGEATILFTSVIGVLAVLRSGLKHKGKA